MEGKLIILSGPSGVGKDTIFRGLVAHGLNLKKAVTATTREKRPNEEEGVHYYFKTTEEFNKLIEDNELLEWTIYNGNFYGTLKKVVEDELARGEKVVLVIDVQGALAIKEQYPDSLLVFIRPPSIEKLIQRISNRGDECEDDIKWRIERAEYEMQQMDKYDAVIENDDLDEAVEKLKKEIKNAI